MLPEPLRHALSDELVRLEEAHMLKVEHQLASTQGAEVTMDEKKVLMFASNNYLGLANHPEVVAAAQAGLKKFGHGMASVRFIAGTTPEHRALEQAIAKLLRVDDAILYGSAFMANLGFFATLCNDSLGGAAEYQDVVYSDELNHASLIDAFKLVKHDLLVKRLYPHADATALAKLLAEDDTKPYRHRIIVTDGVFSTEGDIAPLKELVQLAQQHGALLFVDDAHGVGVLGQHGGGTPEYCGVHGQVDILSGTLGKAFGGALGGYLAGAQPMVDFLRQKSRTYIFSNGLPPALAISSHKAIELAVAEPKLRERMLENARYLRDGFKRLGFTTVPGVHPIVPLIVGDTSKAQRYAQYLLEQGIFVVGLWFPVVPHGQERLRFQVSAVHTRAQLDAVLAALERMPR